MNWEALSASKRIVTRRRECHFWQATRGRLSGSRGRKMTIKSLTVHLDETTDARLGVLSQRCDTTPERFVEMLCQSLDGETLERVVLRAMVDDTTPEPGIAKMPERRVKAVKTSD